MNNDATEHEQADSAKTWDAALYDSKHSFVWKYGASLIDVLAPQPGERILDLGCGTGHLTAQIAAAGAEVIGIDNAPGMIESARASYPHLRFELADAVDFAFAEPFDAVFSNAAIHWMQHPERVAACIARALKPGGRFVVEFGGRGNVKAFIDAGYAAVEAAGYPSRRETHVWFFPNIGEYATLLERQGLEVTSALLFDRPTPLEGGEEGLRLWMKMFGGAFLAGLSVEHQDEVIRRTEVLLRPTQYREGTWIAPYRRLRIVAYKESVEENG